MSLYRPNDYRTPRTMNEAFGEPWCITQYQKQTSVLRWTVRFIVAAVLLFFVAGLIAGNL